MAGDSNSPLLMVKFFGMTTPANAGAEMYDLIRRLYPIPRSITGDGVRKSLSIMQEYIPLEIHEVPSGTPVFDWHVPKEWRINDAYVRDSAGKRIVDFQRCNLHVVGYSTPIRKVMTLSELRPHLHSIPEHPEWIPYRTSYYRENWGFCLSHNQLQELVEDNYEVVIDSSFEDGSLTYGEFFLPGKSKQEVLIYCHTCHPALCNDNLSGMTLCIKLAQLLRKKNLRYSYRFVFAPATIGSITWLSRNEGNIHRIKHGLIVSLVGDRGKLHYKMSRDGNTEIDKVVVWALENSGRDFGLLEFVPYGYDERQFCSPGINLPVGRLTRTPNGCYDEYHSSADNLSFISAESLGDSLEMYLTVIELLERNVRYQNLSPKGEPQLGKRGLLDKVRDYTDMGDRELAMLWVLNLSDGDHSLLDISERSKLDFWLLASVCEELKSVELIRETSAAS